MHTWQGLICIPNLPLCTDHEFVHINPLIGPVETTRLDAVREFRVDIESLPAPKVTWLKDGSVLGDVAVEISTSLLNISETRWPQLPPHQPHLSTVHAYSFCIYKWLKLLYLWIAFVLKYFKSVDLKLLCGLFRYQGVLTLIRAKAEDSGNYTVKAELGSLTTSYNFYLQVKGGTFFFFCTYRLFLSLLCLPTFTCVCFCLCLLLVYLDAPLYLSSALFTYICLCFSCCQLEDLCQAICSYMYLQYKCWISYVLDV